MLNTTNNAGVNFYSIVIRQLLLECLKLTVKCDRVGHTGTQAKNSVRTCVCESDRERRREEGRERGRERE